MLCACFVVSRLIVKACGVTLGYHALYEYWQYLDVRSLEHNLLQSLWYLHSQPPVFNLLLGIVLKCSGTYSPHVFAIALHLISFVNALLIYRIITYITGPGYLAMFFSLLYLLSPATILYENELFYTGLVSMLLLVALYFYQKYRQDESWKNALGIFSSLGVLCLTRSMYHLFWLVLVTIILMYPYLRRNGFRKLLACALLSLCTVSGWYVKNYVVFGKFATSSWTGINLARIVFNDVKVTDSTGIAAIHPFYPLSYYKKYIPENNRKMYAGLNDMVLLRETKNGSFVNFNHVDYIRVSEAYTKAGIQYLKQHPDSYLKNICKAFIIFFSPASSYFHHRNNNNKIHFYDMLYSLNPSHLFANENDKRVALAIAAIPKFFVYLVTFMMFLRNSVRRHYFSAGNIFIVVTILFVLGVGTLLEYGENMRFRFETEPLFLILLCQVTNEWLKDRHGKRLKLHQPDNG